VTSQTGRASIAWNAALELERVELDDALALVLLVVDEPLFARASTRWLGRLCLEVPSLTLPQAQLEDARLLVRCHRPVRGLPSSGWACAVMLARVRTCVRGAVVTSQGSAYARFQRALRTGRASVAWNAALEVERVDLEDALALVLLVVDEPLFARASARWLGRLCLEMPSLTLPQAQLAAAGLNGLPDRGAARALAVRDQGSRAS
jgi:hypothetical protein